MEPARWLAVREIFEQALETSPEERAEYLNAACGEDEEIRREVDSLLRFHAQSQGPLEGPFAYLPPHEDGAEAELGQTVDAYRLVRVLGRGGMSTVYLAERADGEFRREVAIKVLAAGLDTEELIRRFRVERQILANLDHPAIARLIDGGRTAAGRPYLVLERVSGVRIDEFCRGLPTVAELLRLFVKVCRAVHYAHQNLVVHRDLKPSNILVQPDGEPKLLDFGIAKLLEPSPEGTLTSAALAGLTPMTPEYASPEQVLGLPITTASDVYSLGALLYELLTGKPVHRLESRSRAEIERVVCHEEPGRPSAVATPERSAALRGDLDNIVLVALAKERERRYSSAEEMAQDLERHLAGLPVSAHPASLSYRAGKFIRRHKLSLTAAAALVLLMVGFLVALLVQARALERSEGRARAVAAFLMRLFEATRPGSGKAEAEVAKKMLDYGAGELAASFEGEPEIKAELLGTLGTLYRTRGLMEPAKELLGKAEQLERELYGEASVKLANTLHVQGSIGRVEGRYEDAERLLRAAFEIRGRAGEGESVAAADDLAELARVEIRRGRADAAEAGFKRALALAEALPNNAAQIANLKAELGSTARVKGDFAGAEVILREAAALARTLKPAPHPVLPNTLSELAASLFFQDEFAEAEAVELEALRLKQQLYGSDHFSVGQSYNLLANIFHSQRKLEEAEGYYRVSLASLERELGTDNPEYISALSNLATLLIDRGNLAGAEELARQAYAAVERLGAGENDDTADVLHNLGSILVRRSQYEEGERYLRRSVEIRRRQAGADPLELASALQAHGRALHGLRRLDAATAAFEEGLELYRRHAPRGALSLAGHLVSFGLLEEDKGRPARAETLYREAAEIAAATVGKEHVQFAHAERRLVSLAIDRGEAAAVEPRAREVLRVLEVSHPAGHFRILAGRVTLGRCLLAQGRFAEAAPLLREAHAGLVAVTGEREFDAREAARALRALPR